MKNQIEAKSQNSEKVYDALVQEKNQVIVPKEIADKARLAIERMLAIS